MKANCIETDCRMWIELEAESLVDAAFITRFKNIKQSSLVSSQLAAKDGGFFLTVSGDKKHNSDGYIK